MSKTVSISIFFLICFYGTNALANERYTRISVRTSITFIDDRLLADYFNRYRPRTISEARPVGRPNQPRCEQCTVEERSTAPRNNTPLRPVRNDWLRPWRRPQ